MSFSRGRRGRGSSGEAYKGSERFGSESLDPSALVHVSDLPEHTLEADLLRTFTKYGSIKEICMLPHRAQALIEFQDITTATSLVESAKSEFISISGRRIKVNYSTSQHIVHPSDGPSSAMENKVLSIMVYNAQYPINVDVLHQICSPHGPISRIAIYRKHNLQAMVEFSRLEDAVRAKRNLNGADIYSGCCTIKVEYAASQSVIVTKNDEDSWDYENPQPSNASLLGQPDGRQQSLLREPRAGRDRSQSQNQPTPMQPLSMMTHQPIGIGFGRLQQQFAVPSAPDAFQYRHPHSQMLSNIGDAPIMPGSVVLMVYGLNNEVFNCQRLFNLLCLYGNVVRVKFLRSMEGAAMVQMSDPQAADRAIQNLNTARAFGNKLQVSYSKQTSLAEVGRPHDLSDSSPSFVDFSNSRNNRFTTPDLAAKNKIYPPFRTLNFWNCPPNFSDDDLRQMFARCGCQSPEKILRFSTSKSAEKTSAGLVQWAKDVDATEALVLANNCEVQVQGHQYPFAIRLSFAVKLINDGSWPASRDRSPFKEDAPGFNKVGGGRGGRGDAY